MNHLDAYRAFQDRLRAVRTAAGVVEGDVCSECPGEDEILEEMEAFWWRLTPAQRAEVDRLPTDRSYPGWTP